MMGIMLIFSIPENVLRPHPRCTSFMGILCGFSPLELELSHFSDRNMWPVLVMFLGKLS